MPDRPVSGRGRLRRIRVDDWPEFAGRTLGRSFFPNGVGIDLSRPGTPTDDAHTEASGAICGRNA